MNFWDSLALLFIWAGIVASLYLLIIVAREAHVFLSFILLCGGYYLSKWVVLKKDDDEPLVKIGE